ncbi:MAG: glycosyltransferase family 4 protein [Solirubrobacteraceae bacterium]
MRVLLLHNRYRAEGGEERAVASIAALLGARGHEVELLERSSDRISDARAARGLLLGGLDPGQVAAAVRRLRADVVHAHNVHPLFGWRALAAARAAGARTVLHLHNFRLFCAIAVAYRDGKPCFRCHGANTLAGVRLRCRGPLAEAAAYGVGLHRQQPRLVANADRVIVLSEATGARMRELGLPAQRTHVLGNFVAADRFASGSRADQGSYALAVGRLVEYKGFDTAIAAARAAAVPLVIAGEGPDEPRLRALAADGDVRFAGWLDCGQLARLRAGAGAMLVPSRCEEACPYTALDAIADGVPVIASDRGGIPERLPGDAVVAAADPRAWAAALAELWRAPALRRERGERALGLARALLGEDRYYDQLMRIYAG